LVALFAASLNGVATSAWAGDGPLSPVKYHHTGGTFEQEQKGAQVFLLGFDDLTPSGRQVNLQGSVSKKAFVGFGGMVAYDPVNNTGLWQFSATLQDGGYPVPMVGTLIVTYSRDGQVKTIEAHGTANGEPFEVPPMIVPTA
jgi:hypothetical protein